VPASAAYARPLGGMNPDNTELEIVVDTTRVLTLYDQDRKQARLFDMRREETSHLVRHISPNGEGLILYSNLTPTNVEKVIRKQIAHFENTGCDFRWLVYQHDTPADLKDRLLAHGFEVDEPDAILVLDSKHASAALPAPVGHDLRRIDDPSRVDDVLAIRHQVWPGDYASHAQALARRLSNAPHSLSLYVVYVEGKPVSTAQVSFYEQGQFASLVRAATLPGYRGRGLFTALVAIQVQEARKRGTRFLDADASPMSRPILEKLGFQWLTEVHGCEWRVKHALSSGQVGHDIPRAD